VSFQGLSGMQGDFYEVILLFDSDHSGGRFFMRALRIVSWSRIKSNRSKGGLR